MASLISDEMVETIGIVGAPEDVVDKMKSRFGGLIHRTGFGANLEADDLAEMLKRLKF